MANYSLKNTLDKKQLFKYLYENKEVLKRQKKASIKYCDAFNSSSMLNKILYDTKQPSLPISKTQKQSESIEEESEELKLKLIINTTNVLDSHDDVHIKGIWGNSIKDNKNIILAQEHQTNRFDKIISSGKDVKVYTKNLSFKDLGYDVDIPTQALIFETVIKQDRNPYMYNQYKNGYVVNHSVGMVYNDIDLAINDKEFKEEKKLWDKAIDKILNKDSALEQGFFWVVSSAKVIEGSAVPIGSNNITPVFEDMNNDMEKHTENKVLQERIQSEKLLNERIHRLQKWLNN